jgi:hypothetical protein
MIFAMVVLAVLFVVYGLMRPPASCSRDNHDCSACSSQCDAAGHSRGYR